MMSEHGASGEREHESETTVHVRRAIAGEPSSLEWLVRHLTPLLRAQVAFRIGRRTAPLVSVDDLVAEAWLAVLPQLKSLRERMGRCTPVLLTYLSTTIRRLVNRRLMESARAAGRAPRETTEEIELNRFPDSVRSGLVLTVREEVARTIAACIERLDEKEREVVILHGIEGLTYPEIAAETGDEPSALGQRYFRAVRKLRAMLPRSIFDELDDV